MGSTQQVISTLNDLVEVNRDRMKSYRKAVEETNRADLKAMFLEFADQSELFVIQLTAVIKQFGEEPVKKASTSGELYRIWMDIRVALSGNNKRAVLTLCERGEDIALGSYTRALGRSVLSGEPELLLMIRSQRERMETARDRIGLSKEEYS